MSTMEERWNVYLHSLPPEAFWDAQHGGVEESAIIAFAESEVRRVLPPREQSPGLAEDARGEEQRTVYVDGCNPTEAIADVLAARWKHSCDEARSWATEDEHVYAVKLMARKVTT
jgi:hypothetical protein